MVKVRANISHADRCVKQHRSVCYHVFSTAKHITSWQRVTTFIYGFFCKQMLGPALSYLQDNSIAKLQKLPEIRFEVKAHWRSARSIFGYNHTKDNTGAEY